MGVLVVQNQITRYLTPTHLLPGSAGWLKPFLDRAAKEAQLTRKRCLQIVGEALLLFEQLYVHLPQKRSAYGVDPIQQLRVLRHRVEQGSFDKRIIAFNDELSRIFRLVRDLHTNYIWPLPFSAAVAILPFRVELYFQRTKNGFKKRFVVSNISNGFQHNSLRRGVEITHWNGVPIERAVEANGRRTGASNESAIFARGLQFLTIRPMRITAPPDEEWVVIRYIGKRGTPYLSVLKWQVLTPPIEKHAASEQKLASLGLDYELDLIRRTNKELFAPKFKRRTTKPAELQRAVETRRVFVEGNSYGYLRIRTFNVKSAQRFVKYCIELVHGLPDNGLIIDVRDNEGGLISAAERLLQIFTDKEIQPTEFQFINSPLTLRLCRKRFARNKNPDLSLDFTPWKDSIERSLESGAIYSHAFEMTPKKLCNDIGQQYTGPVVLIVNALSYSATDIFAAGFQDNSIGPVIGVDNCTGAGGANVWTHHFLSGISTSESAIVKRLPKGANFTVAARRTLRTGKGRGMELENFGVVPKRNHRFYMTKDDLLHHNANLIRFAVKKLPHV
jgi:hypothetical protein